MATLTPKKRRRVALVGGIALWATKPLDPKTKIKRFASAKEGGTGELRRLVESIKRGGVDEVWILVCWIGHSETGAIEAACTKRGIPVTRFRGPGQARKRQR